MEKFSKLSYKEVETKKVNINETSFILKPLERGFANTLGNAVRRTLLSSISGVAPFAIKIAGAEHEFQTLSGVSEDVVQLILNLKTLKFEYNKEIFKDNEVIKVSLNASAGEITGKDLILPAGVKVVDPDHYIATTAKAKALDLEIFLISGRGFISYEENKLTIEKRANQIESSLKSGKLIAIDSDFSPVERVSYEAVELNSSSAIIQEKLTINVKTDGSVTAADAIAQAAQILSAHLGIIADVSNLEPEVVFQDVFEEDKKPSSKPISITSLDLSVRSYNCLKRAQIETLDDLSKLTKKELSNIKNLGARSINEIIEKLAENDIALEEGE